MFFLDEGGRWMNSYIYINSWKIVVQHGGLLNDTSIIQSNARALPGTGVVILNLAFYLLILQNINQNLKRVLK